MDNYIRKWYNDNIILEGVCKHVESKSYELNPSSGDKSQSSLTHSEFHGAFYCFWVFEKNVSAILAGSHAVL